MKIVFTFILTFLISVQCFPKGNVDFDIEIDNIKKELFVPDGYDYCWYQDGKVVDESNKNFLSIKASGKYLVQIFNKSGIVTTKEITIVVSANGTIYKIYTIGDSTVQDYNAGYYPRKGWGQVLSYFFNSANVQVINKAAGGTSAKSFYNNQWPAVRNALQAGDYVFIQFGINDRNKEDTARYAPTGGVFEGYLTRFVDETKAKGAFPVLITTLRRNAWNADNKTVYDAYHDHPIAVRTVAKKLNVPLIDLDAKSKLAMEKAGMTYVNWYWYNNYQPGEYPNYKTGNADNVHFQEMGAIEMAKLITEGVKELAGDQNMKKLSDNIAIQNTVNVTPNKTGAGILTNTSTYPAGLTITLKAIPDTAKNHKFISWTDVKGKQLTIKRLYSFTMPSSDISFTGNFDGIITATVDKDPALHNSIAFPNPFSESLTVQLLGDFSYSLINETGNLVEQGNGHNNAQIGTLLRQGLYLVILENNNNHFRFKISKK